MRNSAIALCIALIASGCKSDPAVVPVSGVVKLDGKPLAKATVEFQPAPLPNSIEAAGPSSFGTTDDSGAYSLMLIGRDVPGAIVGEHKVIIRTTLAPAQQRGDSVVGRERVPAKYNSASELTFSVKAGAPMTANWDLKSQ